ncbi:hypothetical protein FJZ26_00635, partial [Candidatus Parvarchaeota archaeon]|nr:hypothetical protein [Candidatus Parvarchaeota archaeon]
MGNAGNRQKSGTKLGFLAILACFALLLVFGCTSNLPAQMKNNTTNTNLTDANYSQGVEPVKIKNLPQGQMEKLVAAHNDFGFRMMKLLTKNESGKNVFI